MASLRRAACTLGSSGSRFSADPSRALLLLVPYFRRLVLVGCVHWSLIPHHETPSFLSLDILLPNSSVGLRLITCESKVVVAMFGLSDVEDRTAT